MVACCHDGYARVFDFANEKLLYSFRSHYGAMLCSAWSPDNEFLITGVCPPPLTFVAYTLIRFSWHAGVCVCVCVCVCVFEKCSL